MLKSGHLVSRVHNWDTLNLFIIIWTPCIQVLNRDTLYPEDRICGKVCSILESGFGEGYCSAQERKEGRGNSLGGNGNKETDVKG